MIQSIELRNFRSHKKTKLDFCDGVNVIIGDTESGKSNIMRAFDWVFNNAPSGEEMRSHWGGDTEVIITFDDGVVTRRRTTSKNEYQINEEEPFKAIGRSGIPPEVLELINLTPTNFEKQFERPFMIDWRPGERGEFINEICNFKIIDQAITNINKMVRDERAEIKQTESMLEQKNQELLEFEDLEDMEAAVERLESQEKALTDLQSRAKSLQKITRDMAKLGKDIAISRDFIKKEGDIKPLERKAREIANKEKRKTRLKSLIEDITDMNQDIIDRNERLEELESELHEIMPDECPLCGQEIKED